MRFPRVASLLALLSLTLLRCSSSDSDATCGQKPAFPCAQCGSDALSQVECQDGKWTCPKYTMFTNECPDGTCFGPPVSCCGPNGEHSAGICHVSEQSPAPSGGPCPKGWVSCFSLYDAGPEPPDAGASVADCLAQQRSCDFCCGNFFSQAEKEVVVSVQPCVCAGPCASACQDDVYCDSPSGPSDQCMACILEQLQPGATCASAACTSPECTQYIDCLDSCSP